MAASAEPSPRAVHARAHSNRATPSLDGRCTWFHRLSTFAASAVTAWVDRGAAALCPRCGIDSALPTRCDPTDRAFLGRMQAFWSGDSFARDASAAAPRS